ncbi:MAG: glycosyltransferase [Deltaproteobacteria bacterium]|jgi:hypothetical protein|nr:glycosyltransferase [Deltaproteobacteria bacterium]
MRMLCINSELDDAFRQLGHSVHSVPFLRHGVFSVQDVLAACPFEPEMFLQQEHLGAVVLFSDLDSLSCIKAFWSIDTHLAYYWQHFYGRLFDLFFTPHKAYMEKLAPEWLHPAMRRLAKPGARRLWMPHAKRNKALEFIGRMSDARPLRNNFCALLKKRYRLEARQGLSPQAMLDLYDAARILPNESIALETNFRLVEGASCGCCLISPDIGEDQDTLFSPGRELFVYRDALELVDRIDACLREPALAETVGKAAWARVSAEHLPGHRAQSVCDALKTSGRQAVRGDEAADCLAMALHFMRLNGVFGDGAFPGTEKTFTSAPLLCTVRIWDAAKRRDMERIGSLLAEAASIMHTHSAPRKDLAWLMVACGGAALFAGNAAQSLLFYQRYEELYGRPARTAVHTPVELCLAWIAALVADKKLIAHGYQSVPGCCCSAFDMCMLLAGLDPHGTAWARALHDIEHFRHSMPHLDLMALARLELNAPDSIDASLAYIEGALRLCDADRARCELAALLERARLRGIVPQLERLLRARFPRLDLLDEL